MFVCQYIHPSDHQKLGQAELVCIDEAAAIPLPLVKQLLGPHLVFMSSTVHGYLSSNQFFYSFFYNIFFVFFYQVYFLPHFLMGL